MFSVGNTEPQIAFGTSSAIPNCNHLKNQFEVPLPPISTESNLLAYTPTLPTNQQATQQQQLQKQQQGLHFQVNLINYTGNLTVTQGFNNHHLLQPQSS